MIIYRSFSIFSLKLFHKILKNLAGKNWKKPFNKFTWLLVNEAKNIEQLVNQLIDYITEWVRKCVQATNLKG